MGPLGPHFGETHSMVTFYYHMDGHRQPNRAKSFNLHFKRVAV